jgi:hypothetical protein
MKNIFLLLLFRIIILWIILPLSVIIMLMVALSKDAKIGTHNATDRPEQLDYGAMVALSKDAKISTQSKDAKIGTHNATDRPEQLDYGS